MNQYIFVLEIIGTIAFAISGSLVAIKSKMDLFGVVIIGVITATFGGVMRDIVLGELPSAFSNPVYVIVASITSLIVFLFTYFNVTKKQLQQKVLYKNLLLVADAIGLGVFTVVGVQVAYLIHV
ncbi:MAG: TRIC cation channel family protein, partial [Bulleidia sp.]|nr:TRIC cation channel family protein [Bulleidia sp.]